MPNNVCYVQINILRWKLQIIDTFKKDTIQKTDIEMDYLLKVVHICNRRMHRFTDVYILIMIFIMNGEKKMDVRFGHVA